MSDEKSYTERVGTALTGPMMPRPGDSTLKKAGRFAYMVASPPLVGISVLWAHLADEVHERFHLPEIARGMSQFEHASVYKSVQPLFRPGAQASRAVASRPVSTAKPFSAQGSSRLPSRSQVHLAAKLPEVPRLKLRAPVLGHSLQHRPPAIRTPALHLSPGTNALRSMLKISSAPQASFAKPMRLASPALRIGAAVNRPIHPVFAAPSFRPTLSVPAFKPTFRR